MSKTKDSQSTDLSIPFDLESARANEVDRILKLLGPLAESAGSPSSFRVRARETYVSIRVLKRWGNLYNKRGADGLVPDWPVTDLTSWQHALAQLEKLGPLAEQEAIGRAEIENLATKLKWTYRQTERWLRRYREGGLFALCPGKDPLKRRIDTVPPRALGSLDERALEVVYHRRELLGWLIDEPKGKTSNASVNKRVQELNGKVSARTLWSFKSLYDAHGLSGLAPRQRWDKRSFHRISERMIEIVQGIRLSKKNLPLRAVYERAVEMARELGEIEPSPWQVRSIIEQLPKPMLSLADRNEPEFRNNYLYTSPMRYDTDKLTYLMDHTLVDLKVKDLRAGGDIRNPTGTRPWLTLIMESESRLVVATALAYDSPDQFIVAQTIRDALIVSVEKPYGGLPDEIWVDNGKELHADHVLSLASELGLSMHRCPPHVPQHKGRIERFFGVLNTRLWATLDGYIGSERLEIQRRTEGKLTMKQLADELERFLDKYHHEVHSQTGKTPLDAWSERPYAEKIDPRRLDVLLMKSDQKVVRRDGIYAFGRQFRNPELAVLIEETVLIRQYCPYGIPDEIEVFYKGDWVCTAFAEDSEKSLAFTPTGDSNAKRRQRAQIKDYIKEASKTFMQVEQELQSNRAVGTTEDSATNDALHGERKKRKIPQVVKKDLLDRMGD